MPLTGVPAPSPDGSGGRERTFVPGRVTLRLMMGAAAVAAGGLGYAGWEARRFILRAAEVPLLPPGREALTLLHLSDLHLTRSQTAKAAWLRGLRDLEPDLVIGTGDFLAGPDAVPAVLEALDGLLDRPGAFVPGSNDYFSPVVKNPLRYLLPDTGRRFTSQPRLPWPDLRDALTARGWLDLTNARGRLATGGTTFALAGVDDPHLGYDDLGAVAGPAPDDADVRLGVAHAPYLRVLDRFAADGYDAVLAGHTHGGQVCVPGWGALTTNCDLEPARAKGLHRHPAGSRPGDAGSTWLHVSAGLGTSPYTPVRVACRPEATLLRLVPRPS